MLTILRAGLLTTVQDLGRQGLRQFGIGQGGALDSPAMQTANLLVGNKIECAVLEITLGQFSVEFHRSGWVALTGADCSATLDGKDLWTGWRYLVKAGQRLSMAMPKRGMRSYLAVSGGIDVETVLGSRATDLNAGFGGVQGRALVDGDTLRLGEPQRELTYSVGVQQLAYGHLIRTLPGPEYSEFSPASLENFWRTGWRLSPQSNRMGFRLQGAQLERKTDREMLSHGLVPGVIQVPHNGQPIILMADAQTTGGYPRIACVIEADLYQLAQIRLGDTVHFVHCSLDKARQAMLTQQRYLQQIERGLYGY